MTGKFYHSVQIACYGLITVMGLHDHKWWGLMTPVSLALLIFLIGMTVQPSKQSSMYRFFGTFWSAFVGIGFACFLYWMHH